MSTAQNPSDEIGRVDRGGGDALVIRRLSADVAALERHRAGVVTTLVTLSMNSMMDLSIQLQVAHARMKPPPMTVLDVVLAAKPNVGRVIPARLENPRLGAKAAT